MLCTTDVHEATLSWRLSKLILRSTLKIILGWTTHRIWRTQNGSTVVDLPVAMLIFTYDTSGPMPPLISVHFLLHVISISAPSVSAGKAQVVAVMCTATLAAMLNCFRPCGMPLDNFPGVSNGARSCCLRQLDRPPQGRFAHHQLEAGMCTPSPSNFAGLKPSSLHNRQHG